MNISQILENLGENRADFIEALSDASHCLWQALDLLDRADREALRGIFKSETIPCNGFSPEAIDEVLTEIREILEADDAETDDDDSDADDGAGDKALQEAYDIIATDDIDPTDTEQLATELMRGWY